MRNPRSQKRDLGHPSSPGIMLVSSSWVGTAGGQTVKERRLKFANANEPAGNRGNGFGKVLPIEKGATIGRPGFTIRTELSG
jgi:hypothetical protein